MGSDAEFRDGVEPLETLGIRVNHKAIQRVSEAVGAKVSEQQHGALSSIKAQEQAAGNAPELLVIEGDGMRIRELVEKGSKRDGEPDNGWRECKVGVVIRCQRGSYRPDGTYEKPKTLLQTYLSTMAGIHVFGPMLRAEAERRGLLRAHEAICLSDAGHGLPGLWNEHFPNITWVIDFFHTAERLAECAQHTEPDEKKRKRRYHRWKGLLYDGHMDKLLRELTTHAESLAMRPASASDLQAGSAERVLWTHIQYLETYRSHMDYPLYRQKGWPIASGHVEATCKRIGNRMKGANKRWTAEGAESIAALICDRASDDNRWADRWPPQILAA
jgi:hypothetical protein